jgi:hypothetical protein
MKIKIKEVTRSLPWLNGSHGIIVEKNVSAHKTLLDFITPGNDLTTASNKWRASAKRPK